MDFVGVLPFVHVMLGNIHPARKSLQISKTIQTCYLSQESFPSKGLSLHNPCRPTLDNDVFYLNRTGKLLLVKNLIKQWYCLKWKNIFVVIIVLVKKAFCIEPEY